MTDLGEFDGGFAVLLLLLTVGVATLHRVAGGQGQRGLLLLPVQHAVPYITVDVEHRGVAVEFDVRHWKGPIQSLCLPDDKKTYRIRSDTQGRSREKHCDKRQ